MVLLRLLIACAAVSVSMIGCAATPSQTDMSRDQSIDQQLASDLALVGRTRVFFGHKSVGGNIVEGLQELSRMAGAPTIKLASLGSGEAPRGPVFLEAEIGENGRPLTKLDAFAEDLDRLGPGAVSVAVMKFCYLDFLADSQPDQIFAAYVERIAQLQSRYPQTVFVHVTTPLKAPEGVKGFVKKIIGRDPNADNVRRNQYNALLRRRFAKTSIYDLAALESTGRDGTRSLFQMSGHSYEQLSLDYSSDGGHLNAPGRQMAARALIDALATAVRSTPGLSARLAGTSDDEAAASGPGSPAAR